MKILLVGMLGLVSISAFASEIVVTKCKIKSGTWPIQYISNVKENSEQSIFELSIIQEDPDSFVRDNNQNGLDLMFPLHIIVSNGSSINEILPQEGLKSGSLVITPSRFLSKRILRLGLISDNVSGVLEVQGDTVASKKFEAQLITVSKTGASAIASLSCKNIKN